MMRTTVRRVKVLKTMRRARHLHGFYTAQTNAAAMNDKGTPTYYTQGY